MVGLIEISPADWQAWYDDLVDTYWGAFADPGVPANFMGQLMFDDD